MNSERAQSYGRVTATLADVGPTKLQPAEQAILREAADTLLFCEDVTADAAVEEAMDAVDELLDRLIASDRWTSERAEELRRDIEDCGPTVRRS
jgi:transcription termination factor NusB